MKRISLLLLVFFAMVLSCKREEAPQAIEYVMENVTADPSYTTCTITCKNDGIDDSSIHTKLLLALDEDLRDAESFPMRLIDGKLTYQLSGLRKGTIYYYGFEIFTVADVYRFKEVYSFNTLISTELRVVTSEITNVGQTSATGGGSVIGGEDIVVSERGICWSTNHNPTIGGEHLSNGYGLGEFEVNMTELTPETRYYVRAYASSSQGTVYGNEVSFTTIATNLPELTTEMVTFITYNSALGRGTVVSEGTAPVTERGLCWSTNHNPTINDSFSDSGQGTGVFTVNITDLTPNTTYYVRAYAINIHGISYGNEVSFTTLQMSNYFTIRVFANPNNGGTVSGNGSYQQGQSCTVVATANEGYAFSHWTEEGVLTSTNPNYTFTVTENRNLVANFNLEQGEGNGTADDPYNVATGISLQSEEPIAWVHGYIVGAVKSGLTTVSSNNDINWSAPFDIVSNVLIADDATCHDISQCIFVNLPAGKPLRTQVNLMDNPDNLGKHLAVNGRLRGYFGQAGLRDSGGTEADFVLEGGVIPPNPGTEIFKETFANGQGQFTIVDVNLPYGLTYVWQYAANYSCMKASAHVGQNYAAESWLVSPAISLLGVSSAKLTFEQAVNYASPNGALSVMISTNYNGNVMMATWNELILDQWPSGNNWAFITSTANLFQYVGRNVTIAFKYTSTTNASATWEVKNFVVVE